MVVAITEMKVAHSSIYKRAMNLYDRRTKKKKNHLLLKLVGRKLKNWVIEKITQIFFLFINLYSKHSAYIHGYIIE